MSGAMTAAAGMAELPALSILLVEDDEFALKLELNCLHQLGIKSIVIARNGVEALSILQSRTIAFDLVITDNWMPGMSGIELLRTIKEKWPRLAVLMLTADAREISVRTAEGLGAGGYLVKPFGPDQVRNRIVAILSRSNSQLLDGWDRSAAKQEFNLQGHLNLKRIYGYWTRHCQPHALPTFDDLGPLDRSEIADILPNMLLVRVDMNPLRYFHEMVGPALANTLGRSLIGEHKDEANSWFARFTEPAYRAVLKSSIPHYQHVRTIENFAVLRFQRLLLPLSSSGRRVDGILGGIEQG